LPSATRIRGVNVR